MAAGVSPAGGGGGRGEAVEWVERNQKEDAVC